MAVDLTEYIPSLKREVNPAGTAVITMTDSEWMGYLVDAFWEARLDGLLDGYEATNESTATVADGTMEKVGDPSADVPRQLVALIILYAGIRILRNRILNQQTVFRAKAGPVEFEQQSSATMLAEMLKQLRATKDRILVQVDLERHITDVLVLDAFSTRLFDLSGGSYFGAPELAG